MPFTYYCSRRIRLRDKRSTEGDATGGIRRNPILRRTHFNNSAFLEDTCTVDL